MKQEDSGPRRPGMISRERIVPIFLALLYSLVHLVALVIVLGGSTRWVLKVGLFLAANVAWILFLAYVLANMVPDNWISMVTLNLYVPSPHVPVVAIINWNGRIYAEIAERRDDGWYVCDRQPGKFDRTRKVVGDVVSWSMLPSDVKFT